MACADTAQCKAWSNSERRAQSRGVQAFGGQTLTCGARFGTTLVRALQNRKGKDYTHLSGS